MKRSCCATAVLLMALVALAGPVQAQDWQPTPIPLDTAFPESQPPRALLDQRVTLVLNANVAEVVRRLAEATGRDWVVSAPSDDFGPAKGFSAEGVPLWQALDKLLEVYGYDWGGHARVIVTWPATKPARERQETPPPEGETWTDPTPREPFSTGKPTPVTELLGTLSRAWDGEAKAEYVCLSPELRPWCVLGHIARLDRENGRSVPAAIGAVTEYAGGVMGLKYGGLRRLDDAFAARAAHGPDPVEDSASALMALRDRFRDAVLSLLSAQQWAYLRGSGEVQVAYRELSPDAAEQFLGLMDGMARARGRPWPVDWARPQRLHVTLRAGQTGIEQPDHRMLLLPILQVGCNIPLVGGTMALF